MNFKVGDYIWLPNHPHRGLGRIERIVQQGVWEVYFDNIGKQFLNISMPTFAPSKVDLPENYTITLDNNPVLIEMRAKLAVEANQRELLLAAERAKFDEDTKRQEAEQTELRAKQAEEAKMIALLNAKDRAIELHKQRLIREGKNYLGIRTATSHHRVNHCYSCHHPVDNSVDIECLSCKGIICSACGACFCSYGSNM